MPIIVMKSSLLLVVGAVLLASPHRANATQATLLGCNEWVPFACDDEEGSAIVCNGICPNWIANLCYDGRYLMCVGDPE